MFIALQRGSASGGLSPRVVARGATDTLSPSCSIRRVSLTWVTLQHSIMTSQPANLEAELTAAWPPAEWRDVHVLLAVSGGADSVAMLRAGLAAKARAGGAGRLHVAHLNHGIRPADAAADEAWLVELCRRLDVPLEVGRRDVPALAAQEGDGLEAASLAASYEFLRE